DVSGGAVINRVEPGSPALQAGLRSGDVIVAINDIPVASSSDLRNRVGLTPVGQTIRLTILRAGGQRTVDGKLGSTGGGPMGGAAVWRATARLKRRACFPI